MQFGETDNNGSFTASGTSFFYEFNAPLRALHMYRVVGKAPISIREFDEYLSKDPYLYVRLLEKTFQINALKLSNNGTTDLCRIFEDDRLSAILERSGRLAVYACNLHRGDTDNFQNNFLLDNDLRRIEIRRLPGHDPNMTFHTASAETPRGNIVTARSSSLHGALTYLSNHIIQDIIAKEFGYNVDAWVQNLLATASSLSTLALVLNDRFDPARHTEDQRRLQESAFPEKEKYHLNSTT